MSGMHAPGDDTPTGGRHGDQMQTTECPRCGAEVKNVPRHMRTDPDCP